MLGSRILTPKPAAAPTGENVFFDDISDGFIQDIWLHNRTPAIGSYELVGGLSGLVQNFTGTHYYGYTASQSTRATYAVTDSGLSVTDRMAARGRVHVGFSGNNVGVLGIFNNRSSGLASNSSARFQRDNATGTMRYRVIFRNTSGGDDVAFTFEDPGQLIPLACNVQFEVKIIDAANCQWALKIDDGAVIDEGPTAKAWDSSEKGRDGILYATADGSNTRGQVGNNTDFGGPNGATILDTKSILIP